MKRKSSDIIINSLWLILTEFMGCVMAIYIVPRFATAWAANNPDSGLGYRDIFCIGVVISVTVITIWAIVGVYNVYNNQK